MFTPAVTLKFLDLDFHEFGTVFQNLSTMIPMFFQSLSLLRIPLIGIVDN